MEISRSEPLLVREQVLFLTPLFPLVVITIWQRVAYPVTMGTKQLKAVCLCDSNMKGIWNKDILLSFLRAPRHSTQRAPVWLRGGCEGPPYNGPPPQWTKGCCCCITSSRKAVKPKCHVGPTRENWESWFSRSLLTRKSRVNDVMWKYPTPVLMRRSANL